MNSVTIPAKYFQQLDGLVLMEDYGCEAFVVDAINTYLHMCLCAFSGVEFMAKIPKNDGVSALRHLAIPFDQTEKPKQAISFGALSELTFGTRRKVANA